LPEGVSYLRGRLRDPRGILRADALRLAELDLPIVDFAMTAPPYMNRVDHPQNPLTGYHTLDGNYGRYLAQLGDMFRAVAARLRPGGTVVVSVANIASNPVTTLAWDLGSEVVKSLQFLREVVVDWDEPPPQFTADYCLIFRRPESGDDQLVDVDTARPSS
jgi:hypothetical protein